MINQHRSALQIHANDDLIVALVDLAVGEQIRLRGKTYSIIEPIKAKHKFAGRDFSKGELLTQYGITVGEALCDIRAGAAIKVGNVRHSAQGYQANNVDYEWQAPDVSALQSRTFQGVRRADGQVGTANYWLVVPLVFCQNRNIEMMRSALQDALGYSNEAHYIDYARNLVSAYQSDLAPVQGVSQGATEQVFANVDGVKFITHSAGCGGTREDALSLCKLLAGYIHHPNVAGATILSLGCQNAQISLLQGELAKLDPEGNTPVLWFEQQQYGQERVMLEAAIEQTLQGLAVANQCQREAVPLSHLRIGVECGGSDGFSGLSANPLIGRVADKSVALGGSAILGEFPELCGVEQNILDRCENDALRDKFSSLMQAYERHAAAVGASFDMNPSPGNIRDGLITDAMKSAGAALKGGSAPVSDVLDYTQVLTKSGLNLLCTPGNDVESTTALAASGANLILFSTGLGTPTGNPIVPVLKISSNSTIAKRMPDIIDFDAGPIISGESDLDTLADQLMELCIATASGDHICKARQLGQDDFIPWKRGVSL
ncbi:MAG: altronate dehydratase [Oceanospirillaceae bacterium]|nr:altronate dehydratase [Oceanospirillaceae bacterium]